MYDRSILAASVLAVILKRYMHRGDICTMEFQKGRNRNSNRGELNAKARTPVLEHLLTTCEDLSK